MKKTRKKTPKILPCPFCGGEAKIHYCSYSDPDDYGSYTRVYCMTYGCRGSSLSDPVKFIGHDTDEYAIKNWNRRHE